MSRLCVPQRFLPDLLLDDNEQAGKCQPCQPCVCLRGRGLGSVTCPNLCCHLVATMKNVAFVLKTQKPEMTNNKLGQHSQTLPQLTGKSLS